MTKQTRKRIASLQGVTQERYFESSIGSSVCLRLYAYAKLLAVNARQYTPKSIRGAIMAAKNSQKVVNLLVKDGERYPLLERDASKPDLLTSIISPKSAAQ